MVPPPRLRQLVPMLLAAALLPSCSLPDDTAATVNGRPVPMAELDGAYEKFQGQFGEMAPPGEATAAETKRVLLERLIDRELMLQQVEQRGLSPGEGEVADEARRVQGDLGDGEFESILSEAGLSRQEWLRKLAEDLALARLQKEVGEGGVTVPEEAIDEYFQRHRADFDLPEQVRASQILLRTREEALAAAKRISGGEPFADVARDVSLSPDAEKGGDLGYFSRSQMPQEFDAVVFSLPPGQVSPVVETAYGFHLFYVTDRREGRPREKEEVREKIRSLLLAAEGERYFKKWLEALRSEAKIRYNKKLMP